MIILVPTDFSENANNAVEYGVEIALATKGKLVLLHVHSKEQSSTHTVEEARQQLEITANALKDVYPEVSSAYEVRSGEVITEILKAAEEKNSGLIVMGTQGASDFGKLFFGSNTAAVIEKSICPVLSVPQDTAFKKPEKILFSTNFSKEDMKGAVQVATLAKAFDATVFIAHVLTNEDRAEVEGSLIQIFSRDIAQLTDYPKIQYKLSSGNTVSMGLDSLISETGADIIALSTRKRGLFEKLYNPSLTVKFSLHANIPLLAFHLAEQEDLKEWLTEKKMTELN